MKFIKSNPLLSLSAADLPLVLPGKPTDNSKDNTITQ
jgi:hypothetical protein